MKLNFELFDYIYDGICVINSEYRVLYWNSSMENYTGIDRKDILDMYLTDRYPEFNHPKYRLRIDLLFMGGTPIIISSQLNTTIFSCKGIDSEISQEITINSIPTSKGHERYAVFNVKDITELSSRINDFRLKHNMLLQEIKQRETLEKKLRQLLSDKEVLIKEVHHRVKNNLMLIGNLIQMQTWKTDDKTINTILNDLNKRIDSIALIHEKLYKSKDLVSVNCNEYIEDLINNISQSMIPPEWEIVFILKVDDIKMTINTIIPFGLIVTEIITNSIKHAFQETNKGKIVVEVRKFQDVYKLTISDTGPGFPEDFDDSKTDSLGWLLIKSLSTQLNGEHKINYNNGAEHIITFKGLS